MAGRVQTWIDAAQGAGLAVPIEYYRSFPVPADNAGRPAIAFMFGPANVRRPRTRLKAPEYVALIDPAASRLVRMYAVTPHDLGQRDAPDAFIGGWENSSDKPALDRQAAAWQRLMELAETVLPAFIDRAAATSALRAAAREFRDLFDQLAEPPLKPYYRALGPRFFAWLEQSAR
jgi:hypothetical protein